MSIRVADVGGEEFQESLLGLHSGGLDQRRQREAPVDLELGADRGEGAGLGGHRDRFQGVWDRHAGSIT